MTRRQTAFALGALIVVIVMAVTACTLRPPSVKRPVLHRAPAVSEEAIASAVASALPEVVSAGRTGDASMFPSGKMPSAAWFGRVTAGSRPVAVMGAQPMVGDSLSSVQSTPPAYFIVPLVVDGDTVGEFALEPLAMNRLQLGEWDWSGSDLEAFYRASGIAEASFDPGGSNEVWVSMGGFDAVIDWTDSQQVIVFTRAQNGSGDGSPASARLEQAAREIEPFKVYSGSEALRLARLVFGTR